MAWTCRPGCGFLCLHRGHGTDCGLLASSGCGPWHRERRLTALQRTSVYSNRFKSVGWALFFGLLTIAGTVRAVTANSTVGVVIAVVLFGAPCAYFARSAAQRAPALVIDGNALTDELSGRVVPWESVTVGRIDVHQGLFNEYHSLVLHLEHDSEAGRPFMMTNATNPDEVTISLDQLSMPWKEVVKLVEQASGRRVVRAQSRGFRRN